MKMKSIIVVFMILIAGLFSSCSNGTDDDDAASKEYGKLTYHYESDGTWAETTLNIQGTDVYYICLYSTSDFYKATERAYDSSYDTVNDLLDNQVRNLMKNNGFEITIGLYYYGGQKYYVINRYKNGVFYLNTKEYNF